MSWTTRAAANGFKPERQRNWRTKYTVALNGYRSILVHNGLNLARIYIIWCEKLLIETSGIKNCFLLCLRSSGSWVTSEQRDELMLKRLHTRINSQLPFAFAWCPLTSVQPFCTGGSWRCLTAIQRGLKASGGDTAAPCTSKYYISLDPGGNISESPLAGLFVSFPLVSPSCLSLLPASSLSTSAQICLWCRLPARQF